MQINRLFEIVYLLLERKSITAQALAERFEVSKRTILRDVDVLAAAKIPVYTTRGRGGGISIMEGYVLNKAALSAQEQDQILFTLQSVAAAHPGARQVADKLSALFRRANAEWIEVDFSRWGQGEQDNLRFNALKAAILGKTAITFEYVSAYGERTAREVYPLKLVFKSKAWYLQGFSKERNDYRTFKLNRMLKIHQTGESFADKPYAPPPIEAAQAPAASLVQLELLFSPSAAGRVYDEFDEGCVEPSDDGALHVFARMPEDGWLYGFLCAFGKEVQVLSPAHVREKLFKQT